MNIEVKEVDDEVKLGKFDPIPKKLRDYYAYRWLLYKENMYNYQKKYFNTSKGRAARERSRARLTQLKQGHYICTCGKEVRHWRKKMHESTLYHRKWKDQVITDAT